MNVVLMRATVVDMADIADTILHAVVFTTITVDVAFALIVSAVTIASSIIIDLVST